MSRGGFIKGVSGKRTPKGAAFIFSAPSAKQKGHSGVNCKTTVMQKCGVC